MAPTGFFLLPIRPLYSLILVLELQLVLSSNLIIIDCTVRNLGKLKHIIVQSVDHSLFYFIPQDCGSQASSFTAECSRHTQGPDVRHRTISQRSDFFSSEPHVHTWPLAGVIFSYRFKSLCKNPTFRGRTILLGWSALGWTFVGNPIYLMRCISWLLKCICAARI